MSQESNFQELVKCLQQGLSVFPDKSEENPDNTLRALWLTACGRPISPVAASRHALPGLTPNEFMVLTELVKLRIEGVPLAQLTERQHFLGLEYIVNKGLYIPRKETELLASTAIETIKNRYAENYKINFIDLCTGIGTVALAVAHYCANTRVFGSDIYTPAIEAAIINSHHFGLDNRVTFFNADLFIPFESMELKGKVDVIVSAPPYISSTKVKNMAEEIAQDEPQEAFDAGPLGLTIFNRLITTSPSYLRTGGYLIFECEVGQGEFLAKRISSNKNYDKVEQICDDQGNVRVLKACVAISPSV